MTFKEFKKGIKAIPFSTWKKIAVPIICVFIAPFIGYVFTADKVEINLSTILNLYLILVLPIVLGLYILRWISDFLSD